MSQLLILEERCRLVKEVLSENLKAKLSVEVEIGKLFEELKRLEVALEKMRAAGEGQAKGLEPAVLLRRELSSEL